MPATGLALHAREFRLPRRGHRPEECEDAVASAPRHGRFAVADGAGESAHAGLWARLLVEGFVGTAGPLPAWDEWLPPLQRRWEEQVRRPAEAPALPWYAEVRLQQGAFATFLGLLVEGESWQALAVGDSCLFHVRDDRVRAGFPLARAADFGTAPWLVGARTPAAEVPAKHGARLAGDRRSHDRLWLMTDALAQWFLREVEGGAAPWRALEELLGRPEAAFADWVEELRASGGLRDDDVAVVGVCL